MHFNEREKLMSWNSTETPLELQNRIREQQNRQQQEREARAAAERRSTYVPPPKTPAEMNPAELEAHRRANVERERSEATAHAAQQTKDRARRAYLESGGSESGFEESWPALQKRIIEDEAVKRMQRQKPAGEFNNGTVNW